MPPKPKPKTNPDIAREAREARAKTTKEQQKDAREKILTAAREESQKNLQWETWKPQLERLLNASISLTQEGYSHKKLGELLNTGSYPLLIEIDNLIKHLTDRCVFSNPLTSSEYMYIKEYTYNPEYPETFGTIDYSLIPFFTANKRFITKNLLLTLLGFTRSNLVRRKTLENAIKGTIEGIPELNKNIYKLCNSYHHNSETFESLRVANRLEEPFFKFGVPIFSGIGFSVLTNEDVKNFLVPNGPEFVLSFRSFTLDIRVAIHFSGRIITDSEGHNVVDCQGKNVFDPNNKVILMTFLDDVIPFISIEGTWEAEVLLPISTYKCIDVVDYIIEGVNYKIVWCKVTFDFDKKFPAMDLVPQTETHDITDRQYKFNEREFKEIIDDIYFDFDFYLQNGDPTNLDAEDTQNSQYSDVSLESQGINESLASQGFCVSFGEETKALEELTSLSQSLSQSLSSQILSQEHQELISDELKEISDKLESKPALVVVQTLPENLQNNPLVATSASLSSMGRVPYHLRNMVYDDDDDDYYDITKHLILPGGRKKRKTHKRKNKTRKRSKKRTKKNKK